MDLLLDTLSCLFPRSWGLNVVKTFTRVSSAEYDTIYTFDLGLYTSFPYFILSALFSSPLSYFRWPTIPPICSYTPPQSKFCLTHTRAHGHMHTTSALCLFEHVCSTVCMCVGGGILISDSIYHVQSILRLAADWEEWGRVYWSGGVYRIERSSDAPEYGTAGGNKIEEEDRAVKERWTTASNLRAVRCLTRNPH